MRVADNISVSGCVSVRESAGSAENKKTTPCLHSHLYLFKHSGEKGVLSYSFTVYIYISSYIVL